MRRTRPHSPTRNRRNTCRLLQPSGRRRPGPVNHARAVAAIRNAHAVAETGPAATRDRALILVGWAGALRRSELVALNTSDITVSDLGAEL